MTYKVQQIAEALKNARKAKGISQRELSNVVSVPQSHISKIEGNGVDLRLSSLIEIARALDLEVELVPRKQLPAVRMITRSSKQDRNDELTATKTAKELQRLQDKTTGLARKYPAIKELGQLQRRIIDLSKLPLQNTSLNNIKNIDNALDAFTKNSANLSSIKESILQLQHLRNQLVHQQDERTRLKDIPPLYTLDTLDDDDNV